MIRMLATFLLVAIAAVSAQAFAADEPPRDNPAAGYKLAWTDELSWGNVVKIGDFAGQNWDERVEAAQKAIEGKGGVICFPAGTYEFADTIRLRTGVVLRGATPAGVTDARDAAYDPPTKFNFPQYKPTFEGEGMPANTAFKGVELAAPAGVSSCGIINIAINHGHIDLSDSDFSRNYVEGKCGRNRIVHGCLLRNAAILDPSIPKLKDDLGRPFQDAWQRWTQRHHAAIHIFAGGNVLVANCRLPESGEDNFVMKGYKLHPATKEGTYRAELPKLSVQTYDITFDYDNRGGIFVNSTAAGDGLNLWEQYGAAGNRSANLEPDASAAATRQAIREPEKAKPWAFAKGITVRNNYVFCTGAGAIKFSGDGTVCSFNVIRYKKDVVRPTARGYQFDSFTNNNRAVEMRGYRWTVEGNDYEVHSNLSIKGGRYGDGEGLMHECFDNCDIRSSKLIDNKGNRYLCIWRVPVDDLEIRGNTVEGGINVLGQTNLRAPLPVKNVQIVENTTIDSGISITGRPAEKNIIKDNRCEVKQPAAKKPQLVNESLATLQDNQGYEEITRDPAPATQPKKTGP